MLADDDGQTEQGFRRERTRRSKRRVGGGGQGGANNERGGELSSSGSAVLVPAGPSGAPDRSQREPASKFSFFPASLHTKTPNEGLEYFVSMQNHAGLVCVSFAVSRRHLSSAAVFNPFIVFKQCTTHVCPTLVEPSRNVSSSRSGRDRSRAFGEMSLASDSDQRHTHHTTKHNM